MPDPISRLNAALEGRYSIERELGEGGMATVYLAEDLKHERKVAIKVLKPELAAIVGGERFLAEIRTTANLQHPHILPLHDSGEAGEFLFYVMPYVEGESLRDKLDREKQLGVKDALAISQKVASALDYAHQRGVVHRDIKPENILLSEQGEPLVADFGIALAVAQAGGGRITETGLSLGTPHYMSPEQATGDRDVDPRSDVFALGCVLYEMLAAQTPFAASTAQAILVKVLTSDPVPITTVRRTVPPHVEAVLARALEKLPADRFDSAGEFGRALGDDGFTYAATGASTSVESGGPRRSERGDSTQPTRWLTDVRSWVTMGALMVAAVSLGTDVLRGRGGAGEGRLDAPVTRFEVDLGRLQVPSQLALSPDGTLLVFASAAPGGLTQLYMLRSDEVVVEPIPVTLNASDPVFSPDGEWIAFVVDGVELKRIPARGGAPLSITTLRPSILNPSWGLDGSILFAGQEGLYRVAVGGGEPVHILATTLLSSHLPKYLPGRKSVLYTHQPSNAEPELRLLDVESGEVTSLGPGRDARYLETGHLIYASPGGSMVAAPFDVDRGEITGPSVPIIDAVATGPDYRGLHFAMGQSGSAVYAVGVSSVEETLVTVDLEGRESPIRGLTVGNFSGPRFDPTGRYIVYQLSGDLWIRDLVLGTQDRLREGPSFNATWSADGSKIAFSHTLSTGTGTQILIQDTSLESPAEPLIESVNLIAPTAWSPDGSRLLYTAWSPDRSRLLYSEFQNLVQAGTDIWIVDTDSLAATEPYLRADGWNDGWASLSPNGGWAAYESNEEGSNAVYVRTFPDPGEKIKVSEGDGIGARWSADGSRIFYRNGDTTKVTNVRTEPTFEVLSHETLFSGPYRGIDPHPDGTHIVAIKRVGSMAESGADRHLYFVVNWLDGVKARLGVGR